MISNIASCTNSVVSFSSIMFLRPPWTRMRGGSPDRKCRSDAFCCSAACRNWSIFFMASDLGAVADIDRREHVGVRYQTLELLLFVGVTNGVIGIDFLGINGIQQSLVHHLHAEILAGL